MSASGGIRKPKIKAPRKLTTPHQDTFERLARAVKEIQHKNASKLSFEEHYRYAYTLVLHKEGQLLYDGIKRLVNEHLETETRQIIAPCFPSLALDNLSIDPADAQTAGQQGEKFLNAVRSVWEDHTACMSKLKDLLKYMDKVYVATAVPPLQPTYALGLNLFLNQCIRNGQIPVQKHLISVLLTQIALDRQGQVINKSALRSCTTMLSILKSNGQEDGPSVYRVEFEQAFLKETDAFYEQESNNLLLTGTAPDYLYKVERRLQEEDERVHHYLHPSTEMVLVSLLDHQLIGTKLTAVLEHTEGGLPSLIEHKRIPDLARLYRLSARVGDGHDLLRKALKTWIISNGQQLAASVASTSATALGNEDEDAGLISKGKGKEKENTSPSLATGWVTSVLQLKDNMDQLWKDAWQEDLSFQTAIVEAFATFINQHQKAAEFISLFLDENLKKGIKGKSENEVDAVLDKAITIFRFLSDKDLFETFYRRHLARRLLTGRSLSDDAERGLLSKLKIESGASFVRELEGMLKDISGSNDLSSEYKEHLRNSDTVLPMELAVQVCTSSHWPIQSAGKTDKDSTAVFPENFMKMMRSFTNFYQKRHSGRKLTWRSELGSVDVRIHFKTKKYEVNVSSQSMIVLMLFQDTTEGDEIGFEEIQAGTAIPAAELKRTLQSLACGKYRILTKNPKSRDVAETDKFSFNDSFTCPLAKFKIQQIANRVETVEEDRDTRAKVDEERKLLARACVVRTMKDRKQLGYQDLVSEVAKQLAARFQPKPIMIKQQIEVAIEQEYLERDSVDRKLLRYMA